MKFLKYCLDGALKTVLEFVHTQLTSPDIHFTIGTISYNANYLMVERMHRFTGDMLTTRSKTPADYISFPTTVLTKIEQAFLETHGLTIKIGEVCLLNTPAELYDIDTRDVHLPKLKNEKYRQVYALLEQRAAKHHFKRQGEYVMKKHDTLPNVYVRHEHRQKFIDSVLMGHPTYQSGLDKNRIKAWFEETNCRKFGLLAQNDRHIAFKNGRFDLTDVKFESWSQVHDNENYTHFYDQELHDDAKTPLWDQLLQHQFQDSREEKKESNSPTKSKFKKQTLFELFGKALYPVAKHDNWQTTSFMEGDANTGKSTLVKIVQSHVPRRLN